MSKIIVKDISKTFNEHEVLKDISFEVGDNNKIGLIGFNGVGKSTLKNIITKKINSDSGSIKYLPKNLIIGVIDEDLYDDKNTLSGGEATKKAIFKVLHSNCDIFILDEPTNHLDLSGVQWLEKLINSINKPMLIISHDRFFLDQVINRTYVLNGDSIKCYKGNYSAYKKQYESEILTINNLYNKQQQEIKLLENNISQQKQWFNKAHKMAGQNDHLRALSKKHISIMRSKEKRLEKLKNDEVKRINESSSITLKLQSQNSFKTAIRVSNLSKVFDKKILFKDINFTIMSREKIGIIGNNGSGKTTLLNLILGKDKNFEGDIYINRNMRVSSFSQCLEDINEELTILDYVKESNQSEYIVRLFLGSVFIKGDRVYDLIKNLSMGEKCRVVFTKIILESPDLIILDEPTNYMDIISRERIEALMRDFNGTVIVVSHDRHLIQTCCTRILNIANRTITDFTGTQEEIVDFFNKSNTQLKEGRELYKQAKKDELLLLRCRLSQLSGLLDTALNENTKLEYENEFLVVSKQIRDLN